MHTSKALSEAMSQVSLSQQLAVTPTAYYGYLGFLKKLLPCIILNTTGEWSQSDVIHLYNKSLANAETVRLQCAVPTSEKFTVQLSVRSAPQGTGTLFYSPVNFTG